jgi:hypothetical protein
MICPSCNRTQVIRGVPAPIIHIMLATTAARLDADSPDADYDLKCQQFVASVTNQ